ncbi:hypothetical protein JVT61DRAFT_5477 [Boletus reticuloceps]|uniref:Uncharacterized protein n=1 Tax=Boletus reticuloceps TaxID=495285 RepID=A0A8I3AG15_9AGAM|nr:hypothetical protein JVT61DRAFT_5477 [Boletus reticuloceps]
MPRSDFSVDTASYDTADDDDEYRLAQKEWQESLEELQQLALVLLLPWLGKFLGRKTSHWLYARYLRLGLGLSFLLGDRPLALPLFSR